jgi:exosortase
LVAAAVPAGSPEEAPDLPHSGRLGGLRLTFLVAATLVAFHTTLVALVASLGGETPLAYAGLVPLFAAGVALVRRSAAPWPGRAASPRDILIGASLLAGSVAILVAPSVGLSVAWPARLDLVALPMFVAGMVIVLFGSAVARAQRFALWFLLLAWPLPFMVVLFHLLPPFSSATVATTKGLLHVVHVARPSSVAGGSTFVVGAHALAISVAATCSGISSFFGFLLLATAAMVLLCGPRSRKLLWIAVGLSLTWAVNLGRILLIFAVAGRWGEHVALDEVHPYAGIVLFTMVTAAMTVLAPKFGLTWSALANPGGEAGESSGGPAGAAGATVATVGARPSAGLRPLGVTAIVVVALIAAVADGRLPRVDPLRHIAGTPSPVQTQTTPAVPGWSAVRGRDVLWAAPYFGETSGWSRWSLTAQSRPGARVTVDEIDSPDKTALGAYGEAAYFDGYSVLSARPFRLLPGVEGAILRTPEGHETVVWARPAAHGSHRMVEEVFVSAHVSGGFPPAELEGVARSLARVP